MKTLLEALVKELVDKPESVSVKENVNSGLTLLEIRVDPADKGKVIGKKGRNIEAMRTLFYSIASKDRIRCDVQLIE